MADLEPAYLVVGTDRTKLRNVFARLRKHFDDDSVSTHDASSISAADVTGNCQSLGLFSTNTLHVVHGVDAWKVGDVDVVLEYLKAPSPDAVLVLVADKLASNSRLKKAFKKPRLIECNGPEKEGDVVAWVEKAFAARGARIAPGVARRLVQSCGFDSLDRLDTDIERIATWAGDETITQAHIDELATQYSEQKIFALTDAWASRDRGALLRMTEQLLSQKEHPVALTGVLARHLRMVHIARRHLAHEPAGMVTQRLVEAGANKWVAGRYVEQAGRIGLPQADAALTRVALLEAELKGASAFSSGSMGDGRTNARIVFERGIAELL